MLRRNPVASERLLESLLAPVYLQTTVIRASDGSRKITGLASIIGKFEEDRLRRCYVCRNAFWARRSDSKTCSRKCLNVYHVKAFRTRSPAEKAEIAERRKESRKYKQKLKKKKEARKYGILQAREDVVDARGRKRLSIP
jgi:hypothetical protein